MGKTIGLKQLAQRKYNLVAGLSDKIEASIGEIEDTWDAIIHGPSGSGKTNCTAQIVKDLIKVLVCRAEWVTFEEGHGKTVQDTLIKRHNFLEELGPVVNVTDGLSFDEAYKKMGRNKSAKIWIFDSIQASGFTYAQCAKLKKDYVQTRKKKIIFWVSWGKGKEPEGAVAKAVEFYANIKMRAQDNIMFPRSRYGGNRPFVIWEGNEQEGALAKWGKKYYTITGKPRPVPKRKPKKQKLDEES